MQSSLRAIFALQTQQAPAQTRSIRLAALRAKRITDSQRPLPSPKIKSGRPKRDETTYGIPRYTEALPTRPENVSDMPAYEQHPLWAFFHDRQSIELPDPVNDRAGQ